MVNSPNIQIQPATVAVNDKGHLVIGGADVVELAEQFGTPLWLLDETTIQQAADACIAGLANYANAKVLYAGKAFCCLAICHLVKQLGLGLDVVSAGELHTAISANFPAENIYFHGNNKTEEEIISALTYGDVKIVVDSKSELEMVARLAEAFERKAKILLRITPAVAPDTHRYIMTGHTESKFGIPLSELNAVCAIAYAQSHVVELLGLHSHIGSQAQELEPYMDIAEIMAECYAEIKRTFDVDLEELDLGGGLGIAYTRDDHPIPIFEWAESIANQVTQSFGNRNLKLPKLLLEPGRAIVGTAGVTLYRAGHIKRNPQGTTFVAVDGGMADNPRPAMYEAKYSACIANRVRGPQSTEPTTIVGKYCESGDIIVKDTNLVAQTGDLIATFATGAYNYSMASNYNRTGRPACVLVNEGKAELIIEREPIADLLRYDRVPARLLGKKT